MKRRDFVRGIGASGFALIGVGLNACGSLDLRKATPVGEPLGPQEESVLAHAALAPSGHNAQPWAVRIVEKRRWIVGVDPARKLPAVDPANREVALSIGAFLENLAAAAPAHGLVAKIEILSEARDGAQPAAVQLVPAATHAAGNLERIRSRRTVRSGYRSESIRADDLKAIELPHGGAAAFFPSGSREARWLAEAELEAFRKQTWRDDAQSELAKWIRFSDEDVERRADGLTPASMDVGAVAAFYMRHFMDEQSVLKKSFRDAGIDGVAQQVREGAGWLVITSSNETRPALIETGRRFERMALGLRERKLAVHPMSQTLEEEPWREGLGRELGLSGLPQFVLRIGYVADYPKPVSPRRSPAAFCTR